MTPNPILGVFFHWLGGLASGSFYVPYRGVKAWSWETYWLVGGFFSWIIAPWLMAGLLTNDVMSVLRETPGSALFWSYFFGVLWGLGGLTFGLTMRYLGMSLGMAMVLGWCAAFGTLIPPIAHGEFASKVLNIHSGNIILFGILVCIAGIVLAGLAGISKEREMPEEQKKKSIKEFDLKKGIGVATFSGVMSACFAFGLDTGGPIKQLTLQHGTSTLWQGLPVLIVVLLGGFTTNFIWCVILNVKNRTGYQYFNSEIRSFPDPDQEPILENAIDAPGEEVARRAQSRVATARSATLRAAARAATLAKPELVKAPMMMNYVLCAIAGTTWYFQFFFYTMGETQMGKYGFSSWTLHMASIIIFSTLWGIALKEWNGTGTRTKVLVFLSLLVLVGSTVIVGYGNKLAVDEPATATSAHR